MNFAFEFITTLHWLYFVGIYAHRNVPLEHISVTN